jgi:hypothetical protein
MEKRLSFQLQSSCTAVFTLQFPFPEKGEEEEERKEEENIV